MAKRRIYLGPCDGDSKKALYVEGPAQDAIVPGSLLKQVAAGLATSDLADTSTAQYPLFAQEIPATEGGDISTAYTVDDVCYGVHVRSGEFVNALVASGQDITARGVALSSNGDGTLKIAAVDGTDVIIGYSDEIINTGGSTALVQVRIA